METPFVGGVTRSGPASTVPPLPTLPADPPVPPVPVVPLAEPPAPTVDPLEEADVVLVPSVLPLPADELVAPTPEPAAVEPLAFPPVVVPAVLTGRSKNPGSRSSPCAHAAEASVHTTQMAEVFIICRRCSERFG